MMRSSSHYRSAHARCVRTHALPDTLAKRAGDDNDDDDSASAVGAPTRQLVCESEYIFPIAFIGERTSGARALLSALVRAPIGDCLAAPVTFTAHETTFSAREFTSPRAAARYVRRAAIVVAVFNVGDIASWEALLLRWDDVILSRWLHPPSHRPMLVLVANDPVPLGQRGGEPRVAIADAEKTAAAYDADVHVATNTTQPYSPAAFAAVLARTLHSNVMRYSALAFRTRRRRRQQ